MHGRALGHSGRIHTPVRPEVAWTGPGARGMARNDAVIPIWTLVIAAVLGWAAYQDGHHLTVLSGGHAPAALSVGQVGLVTFGLVFAVYGMMGLTRVSIATSTPYS
jgi:hypothetical protein